MAEQENVERVQAAYAAFQRGDIEGLLGFMTDDIDWDVPGSREAIPYAGRQRGHAGVTQFFSTLAQTEDISHFEPREFIAQGDKVVVLGNYKGRVKASNRTYDIDWLHIFTLRGDRIAAFREFVDTAALADAHRAATAQTA
ncbi:MAG TPA: nuclear transport factor 2 family protein [Pyrinomonadaceae bacterium]|nr:nuclear transport factor 2 family protein [Pyrinomonadaceae bacterium]